MNIKQSFQKVRVNKQLQSDIANLGFGIAQKPVIKGRI